MDQSHECHNGEEIRIRDRRDRVILENQGGRVSFPASDLTEVIGYLTTLYLQSLKK